MARTETGCPSDGNTNRASIGTAKTDEAANHPVKTAENFSGSNNKVVEAPTNPGPTIAPKANIDLESHFPSGVKALVSGRATWPGTKAILLSFQENKHMSRATHQADQQSGQNRPDSQRPL
jgi:hypothetical protein